jgi:hypothetical protein
MRRETLKTNKTVIAELELEAPFSAKQKGVLHFALPRFNVSFNCNSASKTLDKHLRADVVAWEIGYELSLREARYCQKETCR